MSDTNNFLLNALRLLATSLTPSSSASVLQTHLLAKWMRRIQERPVHNTMCKFCNSMLTNSFRVKILPKKVARKNMRRLLRRVQSPNVFYVSKLQQSLVKKFSNNQGNKLVLTCRMCKKKNIRLLEKPVKDKQIRLNVPIDINPAKKNRKRRKKKDRLAGLKASAVVAANVSESESSTLGNNLELLSKKKKTSGLALPSLAVTSSGKAMTGAVVTQGRATAHSQKKTDGNTSLLAIKSKKKTKNKNIKDAPRSLPLTVVKKFKKCNKLTEMLAQAETEKLVQKKKPKSSLLAALEGMLR